VQTNARSEVGGCLLERCFTPSQGIKKPRCRLRDEPPRRVRGARAGKHARALAVLRGGPERQNKKVRELPTVGRGNFCKIQIPAQTLSIWLAQVIRPDSTWSEQSRSSRSSSRRRSSPRFVWPADPHPLFPQRPRRIQLLMVQV
jgi:hypothetical protein